MPPPGFEPAIPSSERRQTRALDRAGTGIGLIHLHLFIYLLRLYDAVSTSLYTLLRDETIGKYRISKIL